uniref:Uncharacterized protein n=1 Tax=Oryza meridionalis TaxID=40149 RepID=A0A0E0DN78_9ORYZ
MGEDGAERGEGRIKKGKETIEKAELGVEEPEEKRWAVDRRRRTRVAMVTSMLVPRKVQVKHSGLMVQQKQCISEARIMLRVMRANVT